MGKIQSFTSKVDFPKPFVWVSILLILYSVFARAQGLGYSNFQGDEINPMRFIHEQNESFIKFLLSQKRGPIQYIINYINVALFGFRNEAQIRFPFLVFGVLALYATYKLALRILGDRTAAFFAVVLMSINGLFIAFSRITQYQSFMYLVVPVGVVVFINALEGLNERKIVMSGLLFSLALLAHYDTLSVIPFYVSAFVAYTFRKIDTNSSYEKQLELVKRYLPYALLFSVSAIIPALFYYVPFYFGAHFSNTTSHYLENRVLGGGLMPRTKITEKLLRMYIPKFHLYFLFFTTSLGLLWQTVKVGDFSYKRIKIKRSILKNAYMAFVFLFVFATVLSFYYFKPRTSSLLVIGSSIAISTILTFSKKVDWKFAALSTWFLGAYSFYFFVMKDPRTHVYVAFIPMFVIAAHGFVEFYKMARSVWLKRIVLTATLLSFLFISGINWVIFVDKTPEYPWWDKDFLGYPIYRIKRVRYEKIEGVFGFNNYRGWEQVADLFKRGCLKGTFNSNEKDEITYFYIQKHQNDDNRMGLKTDVNNIILAEAPHSWIYPDEYEIPKSYRLLKVLYTNGIPVVHIYGDPRTYSEGKLLCE